VEEMAVHAHVTTALDTVFQGFAGIPLRPAWKAGWWIVFVLVFLSLLLFVRLTKFQDRMPL